jgi:hypothetical protein
MLTPGFQVSWLGSRYSVELLELIEPTAKTLPEGNRIDE